MGIILINEGLKTMNTMFATKRHVIIDGSYGEGGGQIVRCGLGLAILTGSTVEFRNIRAKRPKPGLQPQHMTAVHAAAMISNAQVQGMALGSPSLRFEPHAIQGGEFTLDVEEISGAGSAGSVMLIAQTVIVPLALSGQSATITLKGGTHVGWSPSADYIRYVYFPALARLGIRAEIETKQFGFYPRGGGECVLRVYPATQVEPIQWIERGPLKSLRVVMAQSNLPDNVLHRAASVAETLLGLSGVQPDIETIILPSRGIGAAVTIAVQCENGFAGFTQLGRRGVPIEHVVETAWNDFIAWAKTKTAVDTFLADQLVLPCSLALGESRWSTNQASSHLRTLLWLVPKFLSVENSIEAINDTGFVVRTRPAPE